MSGIGFFPTPYPDELFYSVLCRCHVRSSVPSPSQTNREFGYTKRGQNVYLPQTIGKLCSLLPLESGMTAEFFVSQTTIFPYVCPLLYDERRKQTMEIVKNGILNDSAYKFTGFSRIEVSKWRHLRYCEKCWENDIRIHGEAYWHRVHILPGVIICPIHGTPIVDSDVLIADIGRQFHPASFRHASQEESILYFAESIREKLCALAEDSQWLLQNGFTLPPFEDVRQKYDTLLCTKGFLNGNWTKAKSGDLDAALLSYYGSEFLETLGVASSEMLPWSRRMFYKKNILSNPLWHLLLMRFLAGSVKDFFEKPCDTVKPYGAGPWLCRNPACEFYLQNTISSIELEYDQERHKAIFACPICGFTYRRSNGTYTQGQEQYSGGFQIIDYGWKWKEVMTQLLSVDTPVMKIMELMHCSYKTVMIFGAENGFFEESRIPPKYHYIKKSNNTHTTEPLQDLQLHYRTQWKTAVLSNLTASRSWLIRKFPQAYKWLRNNDIAWYEANSPTVKTSSTDWNEKDRQYLNQACDAVEFLLKSPGKPIWVTLRAVERYSEIPDIYRAFSKNHLPLTKAYLDEHIETRLDWNKRKIRWAIKEISDSGQKPGLANVRLMSGLTLNSDDPLRDYIEACIKQMLGTDDS